MFEKAAPEAQPTRGTPGGEVKLRSFDVKEVGVVREVRGMIARIDGLPSCIDGQLVTFGSEIRGMVIGYEPKDVYALILGDAGQIKTGERVYGRAEPFRIPVGNKVIGRLVNSLAEPIDGQGPLEADQMYPVFRKAPGIMERVPIFRPLETGVKIIDAMIPIGKGQRELILGDRMTGKSTLALDAILNQRGKQVICVYCLIGRSYTTLTRTVQLLKSAGALEYSFVVAETAAAPAGRQFLTPYSACALGEYFMDRGKDVLVVFDDLSKHAWIHREISLLLGRSPGREAYPGDMFYIHSQLVERAAALSPERGGGSMTFLPLVETQAGNITGLIPSYTISMTDGQIYLSTELFTEGFKPAIDLGLSVSRVGSKVQSSALKEVSKQLRLEYLQFKELERLTRMRAHLSDEAAQKLKRGTVLRELLIQDRNQPVSTEEEIVLFEAYHAGVLTPQPLEEVRRFKREFFAFFAKAQPQLVEELRAARSLTEKIKAGLKQECERFFKVIA
ncbi:MAG: F0F1 ATP synthase subunit alpha [Candidatus Omnitrophica bacterium]|nr:F0F1 ATP synthase subunit alpha [Candidatus Omnitrophota bacterium]